MAEAVSVAVPTCDARSRHGTVVSPFAGDGDRLLRAADVSRPSTLRETLPAGGVEVVVHDHGQSDLVALDHEARRAHAHDNILAHQHAADGGPGLCVRVMAWTVVRHVVSESGNVKVTWAWPVASVCTLGAQKAVSGNALRTRGLASLPGFTCANWGWYRALRIASIGDLSPASPLK